jgi:S-DNA-T family DNA segregation ATPase FtsK/SpoIIIE
MSDEHEEDVPATLEELREQLKRLREQENAHYTEMMLKLQDIHDAVEASVTDQVSGLYDEAVALVRGAGEASTSFLQRVLGIGYVVAAKLMDEMEARRVIGRADGQATRNVLPFDDEIADTL